MSQAQYPELKTHMMEHHWLQNRPRVCNSLFLDGIWDGCEPNYFNQGERSVPVTLFYDGHVEGFGHSEAVAADARLRGQQGYGTWHRETPFGNSGYFGLQGYDTLQSSHHILTINGIRGRDKTADH